MKNILKTCTNYCHKWSSPDFGLLVLRVVVGVAYIFHGWMKLMAIPQTQMFFTMFGIPAWLSIIVALIELFGGIALVLGVLVRLASTILAVVMVGAIVLVKLKVGTLLGAELDIVLFAVLVALSCTGGGKFGFGQKTSSHKNICTTCAPCSACNDGSCDSCAHHEHN